MASVRFVGAVLNRAVGEGTATEMLTLAPLESVTTTNPLPLVPAAAAIVNAVPLNETLIKDGVSALTAYGETPPPMS